MTLEDSVHSKYFTACNHRLKRSPFYSCYAGPEVALGIYNRRLYPWTTGHDPIEVYWHLRKKAVLYDVPETPLEIEGPDAVRLLNKVLTRKVEKTKVGRAGYGLACLPNGGILMDGMLVRLAEEKFWYIQADGDFLGWLNAHAIGMDVEIRDPHSWAIQVQGPESLNVLKNACDGPSPDPFNYFDVSHCEIAGQELMVSRTGWTGELGFELYTPSEDVDGPAIWNRLLEAGQPQGLIANGLESMSIRRIEAGIMDYGTDLNENLNPYQAGLGNFVHLSKPDFIGKQALEKTDKTPLLYGFLCDQGTPARDSVVSYDKHVIGRVTSSAWSPYLEKGIGYWLAGESANWHGKPITVASASDEVMPATVAEFPFFDAKKEIPRGLAVME